MASPQENPYQFQMDKTTNAYLGALKQQQDVLYPSSNLVKNVASGKLFRKYIQNDPIFYEKPSRGKAPYRIISYTLDGNLTMYIEYIASDSPLIRSGVLHSSTYRKYFMKLPQDTEIVFANEGEQCTTRDYNNLLVNLKIMGYESFSINNLIQILGVVAGAGLSIGGTLTGNPMASRLGQSIGRASTSLNRVID